MKIKIVKDPVCPMCLDDMPPLSADYDGWELVTNEVLDNDNRYKAIYLCSESCRDALAKILAEKKGADSESLQETTTS